MSKRAFAIGAHPDDIEFVMAGTLLLLGRAGYDLHYMTVANGCLGSVQNDPPTTASIRVAEARRSAELAGAVYHEPLVDDLDIYYTKELLARLTSIMRDVRPEIVLTHPPRDYMEDHTNTCRLTVSAAFFRTIPHLEVVPPRSAVEQPVTVYHAQPMGNRDDLWRFVKPGLYVDIGDVLDEKTAMLARHESQKEWLDRTQGVGSYLEIMREQGREMGRCSGRFTHAEGWTRHSPLGMCAVDADPLRDALAEHTFESPGSQPSW